MPRPTDLLASILAQVRGIAPSHDGDIAYFPCSVQLCDTSSRARVTIVDADAFARHWGVLPDRSVVDARDVVLVAATPHRLPAPFADVLYKAGESGMGYCVFALRFRDGSTQPYLTGNAVDFLEYPVGLHPVDVAGVDPHGGRGSETSFRAAPFDWCPVAGLDAALGISRAPRWKFWHRARAT